jgi:uncharacterized protein YjbI with pentapeptide repeats
MWKQIKTWWIEDPFGPRRKHMFLLRIRARVLKLRFLLWWRRPKARKVLHYSPKPLALLVIGILVPILVGALLSYFSGISPTAILAAFRNLLGDPGKRTLEWRDATQLLIVLIGVPAGFLLWLFRDINVSGTLENQRKDVNLKEFQEIQMRAAGAMDEKLPAEARETLQIAALHQLRTFLRGEYGNGFRRPAFELLRARLVASAKATGTQELEDWLVGWRTRGEIADARLLELKDKVYGALAKLRSNRVAETEQTIVREEWQAIFRSGLPLAGSVFDRVLIHGDVLLAALDIAGCRFIGANLAGAHFEEARLAGSNFAGANLALAHLECTDLDNAKLEGANLQMAQLQHASLRNARLDAADLYLASLQGTDLSAAQLDLANLKFANLAGSKLRGASLVGADLTGADLSNANLRDAEIALACLGTVDVRRLERCDGASFDDGTEFAENWLQLSAADKEVARAPWVELGAIRTQLVHTLSRPSLG